MTDIPNDVKFTKRNIPREDISESVGGAIPVVWGKEFLTLADTVSQYPSRSTREYHALARNT